jgi:V/A-type H+-transporting ATPase subunit D
MAQKVKLTRPELKRYRDRLARCERYLPMLKLKQQQLQIRLRDAAARRHDAEGGLAEVEARLDSYRSVLADLSGVPLEKLSHPERVITSTKNIAGIDVQVFEDAVFPEATYSLFGTPPWVDGALEDLRERSHGEAAVEVLRQEEAVLQGELRHVIQHVNLFEKVLIPHYEEAIRRIRIHLGDEMTAAIGRAKIAKSKLTKVLVGDSEEVGYGRSNA